MIHHYDISSGENSSLHKTHIVQCFFLNKIHLNIDIDNMAFMIKFL